MFEKYCGSIKSITTSITGILKVRYKLFAKQIAGMPKELHKVRNTELRQARALP